MYHTCRGAAAGGERRYSGNLDAWPIHQRVHSCSAKIGIMQSGLVLTLFLYGAGAVAVVAFLVAILRIRRDCTRISHSLEEIAAAIKTGPRP
jgi:hypothetical protein